MLRNFELSALLPLFARTEGRPDARAVHFIRAFLAILMKVVVWAFGASVFRGF